MKLREFVELFDKNDVKDLFKSLSLCMEYVRIDLHVFNVGAYVTCLYSNDLEQLSTMKGCAIYAIVEVPCLFEAFMEFDDFVNKVDRSQLPEGIKFELK